ncbi:MAG: diguanylate cyclase [Sulfurimonas sp. RIFOXYD12_FULL_33_39]|uniref:GGDEF domain-containing protein n=1 Tax=unclassified Sulfurimonas TaxID=2623549 RepID=UPI0008C10118|nr:MULTISPECIES: GGDEF domain-containing protein [unclassified Sulfurimonas]OHE06317.1 MAG: diguanylate cyclase [Sulfurimonas sp. RIFCSPLOWO2_12_FULL_34_6]OHE09125.1 MAG: diguanylate cyclase [Sulfurimonas sp. RIFOXYD12_FULL_33_39]OHE14442.1 MAG: diguanylate cyclase [Sulfurimonas sp. RIFOXYD2_FULL_34_21]
MTTKSKLMFVVTIMLLGLTAATIVNIALNFREYSIKSATDKAEMAANIVKDGITAHMVNGIMDKREYFLNQISSTGNVEFLRLIRSQNVIKQYGDGFDKENTKDAIDEKVLKTGEAVEEITETANSTKLRVTIPYKATSDNTVANCLTCHNVNKGEVLGVISMQFDITETRNSGMVTVLKILGINLLFIFIVLLLMNYFVTPYMQLFSNLQEGIKKAYSGDFTHEFVSKVGGDAKNVVKQMNSLFSKMQETFGDIKFNLATFIPQGAALSNDPLHEAKTIINELSDIYKFKKTIEHDGSKNEVYTRIIDILKLKYHVGHFAFYEVNNVTMERKLIYSTEESTICYEKTNKNALECRAHRTNTVTISTEFPNLCQACLAFNSNYVCIPFSINKDVSLTVSMTSEDINEVELMKKNISSIKHYLEAAKPVIESQILMEKLKDTSLRDGMTGLYNRRFLEEFIDKIMSQAGRNKDIYTVMMLDVDFFKMVNDTYGHDVGDKVIVALSKILKNSIRESDLAIRYGGEEFVVMLHNADSEGAMEVAKKIHSAFAALSFDVGTGDALKKTISIGMAKFPSDGDTIWKCIKYADTALYEAKNTGRNKIVEFTPDMFKSGEEF